MGFLNILGKIAGAVTGLGSIAGKQQEGEAKGAVAQAQLQQGQDRNAIDLYQAQQAAQNQAGQLDLQRQGFETSNRGNAAKQALVGALLSGGHLDPVSVTGGKSSGGLLAALKADPNALAAMRNLGQQGDVAQMKVPSYQGGNILQAPSLTPFKPVNEGGFLSKLTKIAQLGGGVLSGLGGGGSLASLPYLAPPEKGLSQVPGASVVLGIPKPPAPQDDPYGDWSNR